MKARANGRRQARPQRPVSPGSPLDKGLFQLRIRTLWEATLRQPATMWALCFYFFIEYVRPQSIYPALEGLPFGQVALGATLVLWIFEGIKGRKLIALDGLVALFFGIVLLSSITAVDPDVAFSEWKVVVNWMLLYVLVTYIVDRRIRYFLFFGAFLLFSLKMSQHGTRTFISRGLGFASWGATGSPGWFQNSGEFAIQMCIFLPLSYYFAQALKAHVGRWKYALLLAVPVTALLSIVASSSRGGQLAAVGVIVFMILQSKFRIRGLVVAAAVLFAGWQILPPEQKARFDAMGSDDTSQSRLTYWEDGLDIMEQHPILGIGYDNWLPYYRTNYGGQELPHNIFIEAGSELGYLGLGAFLLLIGGTFYTNLRTRRVAAGLGEWEQFFRSAALGLDAALVGFMISGFFVTVLFYPFFWVNLAMTGALHLTARREALRMKRLRQVRKQYASRSSPRGGQPAYAQGGPAIATKESERRQHRSPGRRWRSIRE